MRSQLCQLCAAVPKHAGHIVSWRLAAVTAWPGRPWLAQKDVNDTPKPSLAARLRNQE